MFASCTKLTSVDVSSFDTSQVINMSGMYSYCSSLTSVNMSSFNVECVEKMNGIFDGCNALEKINTPCNLKISVEMPEQYNDDKSSILCWFSDGNQITELPKDLNQSVLIERKPLASAIRAVKTKVVYVYGE